jgi:hypothetical protein
MPTRPQGCARDENISREIGPARSLVRDARTIPEQVESVPS